MRPPRLSAGGVKLDRLGSKVGLSAMDEQDDGLNEKDELWFYSSDSEAEGDNGSLKPTFKQRGNFAAKCLEVIDMLCHIREVSLTEENVSKAVLGSQGPSLKTVGDDDLQSTCPDEKAHRNRDGSNVPTQSSVIDYPRRIALGSQDTASPEQSPSATRVTTPLVASPLSSPISAQPGATQSPQNISPMREGSPVKVTSQRCNNNEDEGEDEDLDDIDENPTQEVRHENLEGNDNHFSPDSAHKERQRQEEPGQQRQQQQRFLSMASSSQGSQLFDADPMERSLTQGSIIKNTAPPPTQSTSSSSLLHSCSPGTPLVGTVSKVAHKNPGTFWPVVVSLLEERPREKSESSSSRSMQHKPARVLESMCALSVHAGPLAQSALQLAQMHLPKDSNFADNLSSMAGLNNAVMGILPGVQRAIKLNVQKMPNERAVAALNRLAALPEFPFNVASRLVCMYGCLLGDDENADTIEQIDECLLNGIQRLVLHCFVLNRDLRGSIDQVDQAREFLLSSPMFDELSEHNSNLFSVSKLPHCTNTLRSGNLAPIVRILVKTSNPEADLKAIILPKLVEKYELKKRQPYSPRVTAGPERIESEDGQGISLLRYSGIGKSKGIYYLLDCLIVLPTQKSKASPGPVEKYQTRVENLYTGKGPANTVRSGHRCLLTLLSEQAAQENLLVRSGKGVLEGLQPHDLSMLCSSPGSSSINAGSLCTTTPQSRKKRQKLSC